MAHPPENLSREVFAAAVDYVIRERKTAKVLADPYTCPELTAEQSSTVRAALSDIVEVAGWAPFHKMVDAQHTQGQMTSPVPWRFYVLEKPACCTLLAHIRVQAEQHPDSVWSRAMQKKVSKLLAGSSALIQVTWLPDAQQVADGEPTLRTVEHIAAASAAVQNLMLAAEARGLATYWSSAGILRHKTVLNMLHIPLDQRVLGSIFFSIDPENYDIVSGPLRDKRGEATDWSTWVDLSV